MAQTLQGQVAAAADGAALARAMVIREISSADARSQIAVVEHRGDELRAEFVDQLARTLVTPLDREDLFRLSRSVDDVLDTLRDFVREADLYRIEKRRTYRPFVDGIVTAIEALQAAVDALWDRPLRVPAKALEAKKATGAINRAYQDAFADIVTRPMSAQSLKQRELIKRLDSVGARISDAADVLTDGALKRGY